MGWDGPTGATRKGIIADVRASLNWESGARKIELLKSCVRGNVVWCLVRDTAGINHHDSIVAVIIENRDGWMKKAVSEECGPTALGCPQGYVDAASPAGSQTALEWRARNQAYNLDKKEKSRLQAGQKFRLARGYTWAGQTTPVMEISRRDGRKLYATYNGGCEVRITPKHIGELLPFAEGV